MPLIIDEMMELAFVLLELAEASLQELQVGQAQPAPHVKLNRRRKGDDRNNKTNLNETRLGSNEGPEEIKRGAGLQNDQDLA